MLELKIYDRVDSTFLFQSETTLNRAEKQLLKEYQKAEIEEVSIHHQLALLQVLVKMSDDSDLEINNVFSDPVINIQRFYSENTHKNILVINIDNQLTFFSFEKYVS